MATKVDLVTVHLAHRFQYWLALPVLFGSIHKHRLQLSLDPGFQHGNCMPAAVRVGHADAEWQLSGMYETVCPTSHELQDTTIIAHLKSFTIETVPTDGHDRRFRERFGLIELHIYI